MPDTTVVYFDSTMTGAPSLPRTAGAGIGVLDACLVDGFGGVTLDSLSVTDNVATGTYSMGHGFTMQGLTGPVILIAGASPSGLNGRWRVTVTSNTQFTFTTTGIANQTASGAITAKRAPAGFEKVYSGTNKAAYRSLNITGTGCLLRVDDADTLSALIKGYLTMSDVDTGTEPFPAAATYWRKIDTNRTTAPWWLIADDKAFWLFNVTNLNDVPAGGMYFGDLCQMVSPTDLYGCGLIGGSSSGSSLGSVGSTSAAAIVRSYSGLVGAVNLYRIVHQMWSYVANPCPVNGGLLFSQAEAWESITTGRALPRGMMPGCYRPLNAESTISDQIIDNPLGLTDRTLKVFNGADSSSRFGFDLTGPWR